VPDFDAMVAAMDNTLVSAFQQSDSSGNVIQVVLYPNDGSGESAPVNCIVKNPVMEEDYMPGSQPGTRMLILFIPASAGVVALRGDIASYNGVDYDVLQSDADRCGGVHIRMRARNE
jgi:hypothetical protein